MMYFSIEFEEKVLFCFVEIIPNTIIKIYSGSQGIPLVYIL